MKRLPLFIAVGLAGLAFSLTMLLVVIPGLHGAIVSGIRSSEPSRAPAEAAAEPAEPRFDDAPCFSLTDFHELSMLTTARECSVTMTSIDARPDSDVEVHVEPIVQSAIPESQIESSLDSFAVTAAQLVLDTGSAASLKPERVLLDGSPARLVRATPHPGGHEVHTIIAASPRVYERISPTNLWVITVDAPPGVATAVLDEILRSWQWSD